MFAQRTSKSKKMKLQLYSPSSVSLVQVSSPQFLVRRLDLDDSSHDSGLGCDSVTCSPAGGLQQASVATARRLDFAGCFSSASPTSAFVKSSCQSPSPAAACNRSSTKRRRACRDLFSPSTGDDDVNIARVQPADAAGRCRTNGPSPSDCVSALNDDDDSERLLVGDLSRPYSLPVVAGKHADLQSITPDTLAGAMCDYTKERLLIVDCRYPYEYDGGHIKGAVNIYTKSSLRSILLQNAADGLRTIVVFHCEFSSKRGPSLARFLRSCDRSQHADNYPTLSYPELYLLDGGYKAFYERHAELCSPGGYVPMLERGREQALRRFRAECKRDSRAVKLARSSGNARRRPLVQPASPSAELKPRTLRL